MYLLYCTLRQIRNYCRKNIISTLHIFSVASNQTSIDQIEHENLICNNCTFQTENLLDYCRHACHNLWDIMKRVCYKSCVIFNI